MNAYATIDDLEQRYRVLVGDEVTKAEAYLNDATAFLMAEFTRAEIDTDADTWDEAYAQAVKGVVCAMVKRSLATSSGADIQSESASVGAYSQTFTYANPTGDLYLKESERRLLDIPLRKQVITTICPMVNADRETPEVDYEV